MLCTTMASPADHFLLTQTSNSLMRSSTCCRSSSEFSTRLRSLQALLTPLTPPDLPASPRRQQRKLALSFAHTHSLRHGSRGPLPRRTCLLSLSTSTSRTQPVSPHPAAPALTYCLLSTQRVQPTSHLFISRTHASSLTHLNLPVSPMNTTC